MDARILRELGMEPFLGWRHGVRGLRSADVARTLGVGVQLVKDRIARMSQDGVITGYVAFPNLRHWGLRQTVFHVQGAQVPSDEALGQLKEVDGFVHVVWFLDSGLCVNVAHAHEGERLRRMQLIARLAGGGDAPRVLYEVDLPEVHRTPSALDWRILRAVFQDAKRPVPELANELGVTSKTLRSRLRVLREEGSFDEVVQVDFSRMEGIIPFEIAVWHGGDARVQQALLARFQDRLLASFGPPAGGYCSFLLRVFAYTPADVQALLREAMAVPGVERVEPLMATGGLKNELLVQELLDQQAPLAA